jgi:aminoacyl tRNA synthase complex-interacting multifunctional protein 1
MVLCASANGKTEFVEPPEGALIGERIAVEGFQGDPATENQVGKKKILEAILPDLKTNQDGVACYRGIPFMTTAGKCVSQSRMPNADIA